MTGNKTIDKILVGVNLLVIFAALGLVVKASYFSNPDAIDPDKEARELESEVKSSQNIPLFKLDKLIINLPSTSKRLRYLDIVVHIRPFKPSQLGSLKEKKSEVTDAIISIAGKMVPNELATLSGKILLEEKLKNKINSFFKSPTVEKIFYSKFVIQ